MPSISAAAWNGSSPPLRFHAAIARRSWSASPGVNPAATIASCITCSWKIGTPSVRSSTASIVLARIRRPAPSRRAGADTDAPCRPGSAPAARSRLRSPGRRSSAASAAAASSSARAIRSGTRRPCRPRRSCRRSPGRRPRISCIANGRAALLRDDRSSARRIADSMPSASTSTLSRPSASRSSLSHWMTLRSAIAAFSIGTSRDSWSRAITKPPTCCDRWRGKPQQLVGDREPLAGSPSCRDRSPLRAIRCGMTLAAIPPLVSCLASWSIALRIESRAPCRHRAARCASDS